MVARGDLGVELEFGTRAIRAEAAHQDGRILPKWPYFIDISALTQVSELL